MLSADQIIDIILHLAPSATGKAVESHTKLKALGYGTSISLLKLKAALERSAKHSAGILRPDDSISSVVEKIQGTIKEPSSSTAIKAPVLPSVSPKVTATLAVFNEILIGTDLEEISNLPAATKLRTDPFYQEHFLEEELAYAALKPSPQQTLAGIFSAKEAVRKCHESLAALPMKQIQVYRDGDRPKIKLENTALAARFWFNLSISHTESYATATVLGYERQLDEGAKP